MSEIEKIKTLLEAGEIGDAQLFAELTQGNVLYDHRNNAWYFFNGVHWEQDKIESVRRLLSNTLYDHYHALALKVDARQNETLTRRVYAHLRRLRGDKIKDILSFAKTPCAFTGNWDNIPHKLACKNGVINLQTGEVETGNPTDYLSYQIPTEYDAGADCPRFKRFLQEVFDGDQETIDYIQTLFGYGMIGAAPVHILPVLYGENGFNGKDTLLKAIRSVLGSGICNSVSSSVLIDLKNTNGSVSAHQLEGLHIAYASESGIGAALNSERVKHLTGNSPITVKKLYLDEYTIEPKHLLLLLTNHKPNADSVDSALWERIVLIEFNQSFVPEPTLENDHPIDTNLDAKLAKEAPGILNWLIQGAVKYYDYGLHTPNKLRLSTIEYREQQDIIGQFIADYCTVGDGLKVLQTDLYNEFKTICGEKIKPKDFFKAIFKRGFEKKREAPGNMILGICPVTTIEIKPKSHQANIQELDKYLEE